MKQKKDKISYHHAFTDEHNVVYSIDMIRIGFKADYACYLYIKDNMFTNSEERTHTVYENPDAQYRSLVTFNYPNYTTIKLGFFFNRGRLTQKHDGFIEFNPNKLDGCEQFWMDFGFIMSTVKSRKFQRADLAIDIPVICSQLSLVKDGRKYALESWSKVNRTEYLGCKHKHNYVKFYNKKIESDLGEDAKELTRLEITFTKRNISIPKVIDRSLLSMSEDDLANCILLNDYPTDALSKVSRYKRSQLVRDVKLIEFSQAGINHCLDYAEQLSEGGENEQ